MSKTYTVAISDDSFEIFMGLAEGTIPADIAADMSDEEKLSTILDIVADNISASIPLEPPDEGRPLKMQEALDALMNPDISTDFEQPVTAAVKEKRITWADITAVFGEPAEGTYTDAEKQAMCIVFGNIPADAWGTRQAEQMVAKIAKQIEDGTLVLNDEKEV